MKPISKEEMDFMIEKKILKQSKGQFRDQLVVVNKQGSGREKNRFVTDPLYSFLLRLKSQEKINPEQVKHNQKYLVM
ncbi:MAG TPA: hypothetical protein VIM42_00650 [Clostridium sp.]